MSVVMEHSVAQSPRHRPSHTDVMAYQNEAVVHRLIEKELMSPSEAKSLFEDVKRFLFVCAVTPGRIAPSPRIDIGWHHFILFTEDYQDFCTTYFGRFIHHRPRRFNDPPIGGNPVRCAIEAARTIFGDLSANWGQASADCEQDCSPTPNCESPPPDCAKN